MSKAKKGYSYQVNLIPEPEGGYTVCFGRAASRSVSTPGAPHARGIANIAKGAMVLSRRAWMRQPRLLTVEANDGGGPPNYRGKSSLSLAWKLLQKQA